MASQTETWRRTPPATPRPPALRIRPLRMRSNTPAPLARPPYQPGAGVQGGGLLPAEIDGDIGPDAPGPLMQAACKTRVHKSSSDAHRRSAYRAIGGDGGIRTLDRALQPYNGLANRRLQPLGHVSARRLLDGDLRRPPRGRTMAQACRDGKPPPPEQKEVYAATPRSLSRCPPWRRIRRSARSKLGHRAAAHGLALRRYRSRSACGGGPFR